MVLGKVGVPGGGSVPNSEISAPAEKHRPSPNSTTALTSAPEMDFAASTKALRTGAPSALTGGLQSRTMAMSFSILNAKGSRIMFL